MCSTLEKTILLRMDDGHSLSIIVDGTVRIHKSDRSLATPGKGDCLGEMALLDHEPRSADATDVRDATFLEISQDDFYEVPAGNLEITQGIVRLLTIRLPAANEKLAVR